MHIHYETELPTGYHSEMEVDVTEKKFAVYLNIAATVITVIGFIIATLIKHIPFLDMVEQATPLRMLAFCVVLLSYIVLHELVHGAAYKLLTHRKLTFGITLSCAYCGVPDILVYRKTALISLLAPFTVFSIVFLLLAVTLKNPMDSLLAGFALSIHLGGCSGDLYDTYLLLTKLKNPKTLMQDTGPKQTFYVPDDK